MEFTAEWFAKLLAIILIDLLLAGDNAVVIAIAARNLPPHLQKKAIWSGTAGAIVVRVVLVFFALSLLKLPGLSLVGGLVLYWIAWRLIAKYNNETQNTNAADSFWAAMKTIIVADTVMGLDNILAIAGASRGDFVLVIFGFLLSIPIMVGGSLLILRLMQKAPWLITVGCALLALVAGRMMLDDWWVREQVVLSEDTVIVEWLLIIVTAATWTAGAVYAARTKKT